MATQQTIKELQQAIKQNDGILLYFEVNKGNELIAKFMGVENYETHNINSRSFHTSWDWIMPVVANIRQKCLRNDILWQPISDALINDVDTLKVWKAVVEFVKFYNE